MPSFEELVGEEELDEYLSHGKEVREEKLAVAAEAVDYARSISPVGGPADPHAGRYRDSIVVQESGEEVSVEFGDENANLIEYGSIHNQEYAVRARTEEHFNQGSQ